MLKFGTTETLIIHILSKKEWLSIKEIVGLLTRIKISESATRATLFRLKNKGIINGLRKSKETLFTLADSGKTYLKEHFNRVVRMGKEWDGKWLLFSFNIPEKKRNSRNILRRELFFLGFGRLHANLWISPYNLREDCEKIIERLEVKKHTAMFITDHVDDNPQDLAFRVWDLGRSSKGYQRLLEKYIKQYAEFKKSKFKDPSQCALEALVRLLKLKKEIVELGAKDPLLPKDLLPDNWVGYELRKIIAEYSRILQEKYFLLFEYDLMPPRNILKED